MDESLLNNTFKDIEKKNKQISMPISAEDSKREKDVKDKKFLINYVDHLEKRIRNLENEKQLIDNTRLKLEKELPLFIIPKYILNKFSFMSTILKNMELGLEIIPILNRFPSVYFVVFKK